MLEYTAFSFRDPKKAAEMFAEDGAFELPYLATFGLPTEYRGRDVRSPTGVFQSVLDIYLQGFQISENTKVLIDTPGQVFLQNSRGHCGVKQNGTNRSSTLLFAPGCREWRDQVV